MQICFTLNNKGILNNKDLKTVNELHHKQIIDEAKALGISLKISGNGVMNYQQFPPPYYQGYGMDPMAYQNVYIPQGYINPAMMHPGMPSQYPYQSYIPQSGVVNPQQTGPSQGINFDINKNAKHA